MSESGFTIGTAVAASVASHIMQPDTLVSQILAIGMGIVIGGPTGKSRNPAFKMSPRLGPTLPLTGM